MATPVVVQKTRNSRPYPSGDITLTFPVAVTANNTLVFAIEGGKEQDPFSDPAKGGTLSGVNDMTLFTPDPIVKDNTGTLYFPIEKQLLWDGDLGYWLSVYLYATAGVGAGITSLTVINSVTNTPGAISNIALTSNVLTVTTAAVHNFTVGQQVQLVGVTIAGGTDLSGQILTVQAVTTTTLTLNVTHANITSGASAGTVNSVANGGRPTFTHGLSVQAYEIGGIVTSSAVVSHASAVTNSSAPGHGALVASQASDLHFSIGMFRRGAVFTPPTGFTLLDTGRIDGTANDYFAVTMSLNTLPPGTVTNVALTTNVLTVTVPNSFTVGQQVIASGLTAAGATTAGDINPGTITNIAIDNKGNLTVTVANSYLVGQQIYLSGITLAGATDLNGAIVTVATASGTQFTASTKHIKVNSGASSGSTNVVLTVATASGAQFTANLTHANITSAASAGTATPLHAPTYVNPNSHNGAFAGTILKHA